jgi:hypothetical protein
MRFLATVTATSKGGQVFAERLVSRCLLAGVVLAPLLQAQESNWQNLAQIRAGTRVQIVETSLKSTAGRFVGFSETDLTLKVEDKEVVIPRDQIYRVSVNGKNRLRNVLIGLAIGAGAGAGLGAAANRVVNDAAMVPSAAAALGGVGAGVGALCPAAKIVYRAEGAKQATRKP